MASWFREIPISQRTIRNKRYLFFKKTDKTRTTRKTKTIGVRRFVLNPEVKDFTVDFGMGTTTFGKKSRRKLTIDLDREQSFYIDTEKYGFLIFKKYPDYADERIQRQRERRKAYGMCVRFGCPNNADKGYMQCRHHKMLDRFKRSIRLYGDTKHTRKNKI